MGPHVIDTASGKTINLDQPDASQITLEDIAGGLSRICRFGAQSVRFHSVAQHAVLVSQLVLDGGRPDLGLAALHHDSHEAYVCDIPAPLKAKLREAGQTVYDEVCETIDAAIFQRLGIEPPTADDELTIKASDRETLMIEAAVLLPDAGAGIHHAQDLPLQLPDRLGHSFEPDRAHQLFLHVHERLSRTTPP